MSDMLPSAITAPSRYLHNRLPRAAELEMIRQNRTLAALMFLHATLHPDMDVALDMFLESVDGTDQRINDIVLAPKPWSGKPYDDRFPTMWSTAAHGLGVLYRTLLSWVETGMSTTAFNPFKLPAMGRWPANRWPIHDNMRDWVAEVVDIGLLDYRHKVPKARALRRWQIGKWHTDKVTFDAHCTFCGVPIVENLTGEHNATEKTNHHTIFCALETLAGRERTYHRTAYHAETGAT